MYKFDLTGLHDTIQFTLYDSENGEAFYRNHLDLGKNDIHLFCGYMVLILNKGYCI